MLLSSIFFIFRYFAFSKINYYNAEYKLLKFKVRTEKNLLFAIF